MKYAELFAGAGGMSLGLEAGGFHPFAHAEIEPHARAVLRRRWPSVRLDGDVTQINGADYAGITLLSGGSPCQDLSVAGKRAGLTGSRSTLFHEQHRIWMESGAPYLLWENVGGALSSSNGYDFATVLSTLVGRDLVADRAIAPDKQLALPVWPRGVCWICNTSDHHSEGCASLSSLLEPAASIPPKFWLSAKACAGILRRASSRGKELPEALQTALEQAQQPQPSM